MDWVCGLKDGDTRAVRCEYEAVDGVHGDLRRRRGLFTLFGGRLSVDCEEMAWEDRADGGINGNLQFFGPCWGCDRRSLYSKETGDKTIGR